MQSITTTYVMKHVKDEDYAQKQSSNDDYLQCL